MHRTEPSQEVLDLMREGLACRVGEPGHWGGSEGSEGTRRGVGPAPGGTPQEGLPRAADRREPVGRGPGKCCGTAREDVQEVDTKGGGRAKD